MYLAGGTRLVQRYFMCLHSVNYCQVIDGNSTHKMLIVFLAFLWTPTLIAFMNMSSLFLLYCSLLAASLFSTPRDVQQRPFCVCVCALRQVKFISQTWMVLNWNMRPEGYEVLIYTEERIGGVVGIFPFSQHCVGSSHTHGGPICVNSFSPTRRKTSKAGTGI